ncbi:MAG TPA: hypothetical protein VFI70_05060 [Nitrososphaeraceae archaeon]|nr:hypothetical protein [Nitrososphaeraceae archaeon]
MTILQRKILTRLRKHLEERMRILRFLALKATKEKDAKTNKEIAGHIKCTYKIDYDTSAARKSCIMLREIGVIYQTRSKIDVPTASEVEYIKFYLVLENLIEIEAILTAAALGLTKRSAERIKEAITKIFNRSKIKFRYGEFKRFFEAAVNEFKENAANFHDLQDQSLDVARNIAHNYTQAQKDIINWWSALAEFNMRYYYYPWFYPITFADMASNAYRSFADYTISGLNIAQNNFDAYTDMSKTYSGLVADNINEMSQIAVNSSNMFELMPRASILAEEPKTIRSATVHDAEEDDDNNNKYNLSELIKLRDEITEILEIALSSA